MSFINFHISRGIPPYEFIEKAWGNEPLTKILPQTNIPYVLPQADEDISLVGKVGEEYVCQSAANRVVKYWTHVESCDGVNQNLSTQIFLKIQKKAVEDEKKYLVEINESVERVFHSAGTAVLPEYQGNHIGLNMAERHLKLCKEHKATVLFCETTSKYSASIAEKCGFKKIAAYQYSDLACELNHENLAKLNDSFSVWCLNLIGNNRGDK